MIGKETIRKVLSEIERWSDEYVLAEIREAAIRSLLSRLRNVSGNKSFQDSMNVLYQTFVELSEPEEE